MTHESVDKFKVTTLEVAGLGASLQALRLPFGKEARSVHQFDYRKHAVEENHISYSSDVVVSLDDLNLVQTLVKRGDEHAKILRGVIVWCQINAPRYFWQEMDRYRIGCDCLSSESTMHVQGKGLSEDDLVEMKEHIEEGLMQKRVWSFSYQTLRRIYHQRRNHRLPQWRMFCYWIKTLPYADELIIQWEK